MYVCLCAGVTDGDLHAAVAAGADSFEDVTMATGCSVGCGCCREFAVQVYDQARHAIAPLTSVSAPAFA